MARDRFSRREVLQTTVAVAAASAMPALAAPGPITFLAIGDWGWDEGNGPQKAVAARMAAWASENHPRFVLTVGDNFYHRGVRSPDDPKWKEFYEDIYPQALRDIPWYASLGNHDHQGRIQAQIDRTNRADPSKDWQMPDRYYQQSIKGPAGEPLLDLFALDTTQIVGGTLVRRGTPSEIAAQKSWLQEKLAQSVTSQTPWRLVFGHHAVHSGGRHGGEDRLRDWLPSALKQHGAQAYICGHDHDLQHLASDGAHFVCTGGGGAEGRDVDWIRETRFRKAAYGFTAYRIEGETLTVDYIGLEEQPLYSESIPRTPTVLPTMPMPPAGEITSEAQPWEEPSPSLGRASPIGKIVA